MRRSATALIVLAIGIVANFLVITGITGMPCTPTAAPTEEEEEEESAAAASPLMSLTTCEGARFGGFVLVALADVFAAVLIVPELARRK